MTILGYVCGGLLSLIPIAFIGVSIWALKDKETNHVGGPIAGIIVSVVVIVGIWIGLFWYYNNTASGQRAMKTQKSELGDGLQRELIVYDIQGDIIAHYEGRFDIDFSSEQSGQRIVFDDEQGIRHVIYPGGGIVIVNEVSK